LGPGPLAREIIKGAASGTSIESAMGSIVVASMRKSGAESSAYGVFLPENDEIVTAIARKIPHYSKYSYLVFEGTTNVAKGTWEAGSSPLRVAFDSKPNSRKVAQ
jgi:hypothetical protein